MREKIKDYLREYPTLYEELKDIRDKIKLMRIKGDLIANKLLKSNRVTYVVFNVANWKRDLITQILIDERCGTVQYLPLSTSKKKLNSVLSENENIIVVIWGMRTAENVEEIASKKNIPIWRIEDGFIRSVGLGAERTPPASLFLDKSGSIYFNSQTPSDLEVFLKKHRFTNEERKIAKRVMSDLLKDNITKYNLQEADGNYNVSEDQQNILVIGQCEDDASIIFGSPVVKLNTELIQKAIEENPDATIYFRPHPDVTAGLRKALSNVYDFADKVCIMDKPYPLWEKIHSFKKVYVITSLTGFEAVMRGAHVRTFGQPFYAGWGITDDFLNCERRGRNLAIEEVFYGAYIHAPIYIDSKTGKRSDISNVVREIKRIKVGNR